MTDVDASKDSTGTETPIVGGGDELTNDGPGPEVMGASTLIGDDVINGLGESLGLIKEIMLDVPCGRVAYAVLSSGGLFGVGDKLYAIPWSALTLDTSRKCFVLNVSREQMENAPGFDKDHWPPMADPTWATDLHNYYGQCVYWRAAVAGNEFTEGRSNPVQVLGA
jgi:sporulation protein YlmC with PRC-barrel domain